MAEVIDTLDFVTRRAELEAWGRYKLSVQHVSLSKRDVRVDWSNRTAKRRRKRVQDERPVSFLGWDYWLR